MASKHAHFYYDNHFSQLLLPTEIDSGHPPAFGMYIAACWKLFGQTLPVSHLAMLPFLWGIVLLLFAIGRHFGSQGAAWMFALLAFADPVFAAQSVLVSPDIVLVFFFLLGLWGIVRQKPWAIAIAIAGLALISMRGMMAAALLFAWEAIAIHRDTRSRIRALWPYIPGGILAAGYLAFHFSSTGWIGYHPGSPWAPSFERVDAWGFARNVIVYLWRMLDFGRVFVWAALLYLLWQWRGRKIQLKEEEQRKVRQLVLLFLLSLPFLGFTLLMYKGLSSHRYLLPSFIALALLCHTLLSYMLKAHRSQLAAHSSLFIIVFGLLSGHLWIYPPHISQGWDASLAHWPWYGLRQQALEFFQAENIPLEQVGTAFPEIGPLKYRDLSGRETGMKTKDLEADRYILWSNVMNDFSDAEREELQLHWQVKKHWKQGGVQIVLYERER